MALNMWPKTWVAALILGHCYLNLDKPKLLGALVLSSMIERGNGIYFLGFLISLPLYDAIGNILSNNTHIDI